MRTLPLLRGFEPVFDSEFSDATEFTHVVGNQRCIERQRVRGDQRIERTYRRAASFQRRAQRAIRGCSAVIEWRDFKTRDEQVKAVTVLRAAPAFCNADTASM